MQPIFNEQLQMWRDKGYDLPLTEGKCWLHNNFIQCIMPDGTLEKLYKYKVYDDLSIEITPRSDKIMVLINDCETWEQTLIRNEQHLQEIENESIDLIKKVCEDYKDYDKYILTSTGKDSTVTMDLVHKVDSNIKVVFNNTSLDCADTYQLVNKHKDWIVTNPKEGFYQYIKRMNYIPNRFSRGCCGVFKEGNTINYFKDTTPKALWFMGVRNDESAKRADREDITQNPKWKGLDWFGCLPVRKWSEFDIWLYILKYNLEINPKYKKGYSRVGCGIACPYYTKYTWVLDKYWYPKMYERWHNILQEDFLKNERWQQLNCTLEEYHSCWNGGLLRPEPTDEVINEMMEYKGITDYEVAKQYFNKTCCKCGKNVRQNDVLAMNMKYLGRDTDKFYCKKCFMKEFDMTKEQWDEKVEGFKAQGCTLF